MLMMSDGSVTCTHKLHTKRAMKLTKEKFYVIDVITKSNHIKSTHGKH